PRSNADRSPRYDRPSGTPPALPRHRWAAPAVRWQPTAPTIRHPPGEARPAGGAPAGGAAVRPGLGHHLGRRGQRRDLASDRVATITGRALARSFRPGRMRGSVVRALLEDQDLG